jgi:23S rRNA pseudoU1915 N3-methylase RlmH
MTSFLSEYEEYLKNLKKYEKSEHIQISEYNEIKTHKKELISNKNLKFLEITGNFFPKNKKKSGFFKRK